MKNPFKTLIKGRLRHPDSVLLSPTDRTLTPTAPFTPLTAYERSSWVYLAVTRIAEAGALVPLRVYTTDGEQKLGIMQHPFERLLDAPNPFTSRFELLEQTLGFLELTGSAYWFLCGDQTPTEIWCLRPDRVAVVPDAQHHIKGYIYEIDGQRIPLNPAEVVHFKRWNPISDFYGLSALSAARLAVEGDRAMAEWNRNTFGSDNAVPAGIINIKEYIPDADFERIKSEWRSSYGGTQRRTAFLRGGAVQWQNIGLSHTELDFLHGRKAHRDEILNLFGLPVALISENATEANAKVAERLFIERTLYPKLVRLAQKITQEMLPFWGGRLVAEFDDIRPTDTQARLDEMRAAYPVLSINEIRERYFQLPPVVWGHQPPHSASPATPEVDPQPDHLKASDPLLDPLDELAKWERFALKRAGRPQNRPFEARALPQIIRFEVSARLMKARTPDDVRAVFRHARALLGDDAAG